MKLQFGRLMKRMLLVLKKPTPSAPFGASEIPIRPPWLNSPPTTDDPFMPEWLIKSILG